MTAVYPSIKELMPDILLAMIPAKLAAEIKERYEVLGPKYITSQFHFDGRLINDMMNTNRIQNALEEIIDAAFCILGWLFKCRQAGQELPDAAYSALTLTIQLYTLLEVEQARGSYS